MAEVDTTWLAGPVFAFAVLLGAAGALKLGRPDGAVRALRSAGLPGPALGVRLLGGAEIALAIGVLVIGDRATAALMTLAYLGFAGFTARVVARNGSRASCGCFGETEAPANRLHVALNLLAAAMVATAVIWPTSGVIEVLADQPLAGWPLIGLTALLAWLWYVLYTVVPRWQEALGASAAAESGLSTSSGVSA